ncbi:hypothetical protein M0R45_032484 [Rubus argutus]|uniref:Uncharacterized protein n=1 Tax=Rubus argutus TaxID=59490 RepID=A0AAW1WJL0_RUBAR
MALQVALDYACGYGGTDVQKFSWVEAVTTRTLSETMLLMHSIPIIRRIQFQIACNFGGTAVITSTDPRILIRFLSVVLVGILSLWANHEASKGFDITVLNDVPRDSPTGQRFKPPLRLQRQSHPHCPRRQRFHRTPSLH